MEAKPTKEVPSLPSKVLPAILDHTGPVAVLLLAEGEPMPPGADTAELFKGSVAAFASAVLVSKELEV